ncbi:hypothetical protein [uncultured Cohaesibacter sp.]|nr:hypothetical protein [uncultured Cohaesibacter sp.]
MKGFRKPLADLAGGFFFAVGGAKLAMTIVSMVQKPGFVDCP